MKKSNIQQNDYTEFDAKAVAKEATKKYHFSDIEKRREQRELENNLAEVWENPN